MSTDDDRGVYAQLEQTQDDLEQNLVGPEPGAVLPTTTATPMMEVVAPATLTENFTFKAEINGRTVTVKVPPGGVEEGQKFMVPMPSESDFVRSVAVDRDDVGRIPVGHWKDALFHCFRHGPLHHHLWCAFCCPLAAIGQVITRLQLSCLGQPGSVADAAAAFRILVSIVIAYVGFRVFCDVFVVSDDYRQHPETAPTFVFCVMVLEVLLHYVYFFFTVYLIWRVRRFVRNKYAIPESENCPSGCEDIACALCCGCCATAQLMRHTADYETYASTCCTDTGLPENVEVVV